ncbi:probable E3 ubiquitin-protein ligase DTX2 [Actinia tenebrosa]|uniref:E3 ubiquitin-protein ligase n=1 Tax=Actinia tenebrosa TaxID=6105 RepID=A0A6P8H1D8_ACTTE|nr:probable E3 ubiquitin-protein ligase DTX2 [Actinia tenebrosa]
MNFIVWEWEFDLNLWVPYSPEVSHFLENAFKNNKDVVDVGQADPNLSCYKVSLKNMSQTRLETGTARHIRRKPYPSSHQCASIGIVWEWLSDFNTWTAYDMLTAQYLEKEHLNRSILDLENTPIGIPNLVDFKKKVQINKYTHFERPIRRSHTTPYPLDSGHISFHSNNTTNMKSGFSPSSSSKSPVHSSSLSTASGPSSKQRDRPVTQTQSHTKQQLSYGAGAIGGTSFGDENDKVSRSRTSELKSPLKQRDEYKRKKFKLNTQHDKDPLKSFCKDVKESTDQDCSICFEKLKDVSGFHDTSSKPPDSDIKELKKCKHRFHGTCLLEFMKSGSKNGWIQCPTCKAIHGIKHGNQPKDGTMDVSRSRQSLPGYHGHGMIVITYDFRTGIQDKEHPHPGKVYYASGFPRICYLPDNEKGQKVFRLLKKAWERRLIFTVATSNTTGQDDTVVWNEIHHKTEAFSNISGHGFPDPNYLDNVLAELAVQGIDDSDDDGDKV